MKTYPEKYCYICTYPLQTDSALRKLYIKDAFLDYKKPIQIFDDGNYKLSIKIDEEGRIDKFVYKRPVG